MEEKQVIEGNLAYDPYSLHSNWVRL
jgi:hypothetical protein